MKDHTASISLKKFEFPILFAKMKFNLNIGRNIEKLIQLNSLFF